MLIHLNILKNKITLIFFLFLINNYLSSNTNPHKLILKATEYIKEEKFSKAIILLKKSIVIDSELTYAYFYLGYCFEKLNKKDLALKYYKLYIDTIDKKDEPPDFVNISKEKVKKHIEVLESSNINAEKLYRNAKLLLKEGKFLKAKKVLDNAISLDPNNGKYYFLLARIHRDLSMENLAYKNFEKAYDFMHKNPEFLKEFFDFCMDTNRYETAIRLGKELLKYSEDNKAIKKSIYILSLKIKDKSQNSLKSIIWKRAGNQIIAEHNLKPWFNKTKILYKEFDVFRGENPLKNPLTGEIIYYKPKLKVGRIRIDNIKKKVLIATIISESEYGIRAGDYIFIPEDI